jgi:hypothetical protein
MPEAGGAICRVEEALQQGAGRFGVFSAVAALAVLAALLLGPGARAQQSPGAAAGVRAATPEEVKKGIEDEEAAIEAEPAFDGLSKRLSHYIRTKLPSLVPLSREDATAENVRFATTELGQPSPFICKGDFDGDGLEDTAVVMKDRTTRELRVMAFHQVNVTVNPGGFTKRDYRAYEVVKAGPVAPSGKLDELTIACNGPGSFESLDGSILLTLKNHSIEFGFTEYYFDGDRYQSLVIGD